MLKSLYFQITFFYKVPATFFVVLQNYKNCKMWTENGLISVRQNKIWHYIDIIYFKTLLFK